MPVPIAWLDERYGSGFGDRCALVVVGVDLEGRKHVLGIWIGTSNGEGSKFWLSVFSELTNRGVDDVLIVVCDGLVGLPDAIEAVWPQATIQTCVVHLLRGSFLYASYADRKKLAASMRPIYTAASIDAAEEALEALASGPCSVPCSPLNSVMSPASSQRSMCVAPALSIPAPAFLAVSSGPTLHAPMSRLALGVAQYQPASKTRSNSSSTDR